MVSVIVSRDLWREALRHLDHGAEQVGFFRADFDRVTNQFRLLEWRPMSPDEVEYENPYHVTLTDEAKVAVLQWSSGASLVEAHSHGDLIPARFSGSDVWGLREWVPHLFWRLARRPYAAIVTAEDGFDALAWIDSATDPLQVEAVSFEDGAAHHATAHTMLGRYFDEKEATS